MPGCCPQWVTKEDALPESRGSFEGTCQVPAHLPAGGILHLSTASDCEVRLKDNQEANAWETPPLPKSFLWQPFRAAATYLQMDTLTLAVVTEILSVYVEPGLDWKAAEEQEGTAICVGGVGCGSSQETGGQRQGDPPG